LTSRNAPPAIRMRSRHDSSSVNAVNTGAVSASTHERLVSSARRMPSASVSPMRRARSRRSGANRSVRMARKTRLSTPRTISSAIKVRSPTQTEGSVSHSIGRRRSGSPRRAARAARAVVSSPTAPGARAPRSG
jgi:hypothetical protein